MHGRDKGASRVYTIRNTTRLIDLIDLICELIDLICEDMAFHKEDFSQHKLVLTGSDPVPEEINRGCHHQTPRHENYAGGVDTIIVQQVAEVKANKVHVVAEDTDIFVLLLHFCCQGDIPASTSVLMVLPIRGRAVIDINATVDLHRDIITYLLAAHGLSGYDTVATNFGIGNAAALRVLTSSVDALTYVGDASRILTQVTARATPFILACYEQTCTLLTGTRQKMWANKVGQSVAGAPKLDSLPPTNEAFNENVARAHLQVAVWRDALQPDPPAIDPTAFRWSLEEGSKTLIPTTLPCDTPFAPDDLLKLVRCSCSSETQCKTQRCSCSSAILACSVLCACQGGRGCFNERTKQALQTDDDDENEYMYLN